MTTDKTVTEILKYKAKALKNSPEYSAYIESLLKEFNIEDPKEAAMLAAIDAMIHGHTAATDRTGRLRKVILKETLKK